MTFRRLASSAMVVALTAVLAVSQGTPQARAARPHSPQVTITIWTAYTQGLLKAFDTLTSRFEQAYPTIKVDEVSSTNYTALQQKEQSAIFAGNTPTLGQAYESWTQQYLQSHAVQDLDSYVNGKQGLSKAEIKDFFSQDWADGLLGKKRYMMPFSKSDIVLYFNRAMLKRAGIKSPPKTWVQFAADCKKVTIIRGGNPTQWCSSLQAPESEWYTWELGWGNKVLNKNNRASFGTASGAAPVAFFAKLAKQKEMVFYNNFNYQDQADFDAGKIAFYIGTSAGLTYVLSGAKPGVETAEAPVPAGPKRQVTELFGAPLVMFSKASTAEKNAAWIFMKWLTEPRQTAYWAENTGYMPVRHSAVKLMHSYYLKNPQERASVNELGHAVVEPSLAGWSKAQNDIQIDVLAALTGSMSPTQAMRQAAKQVDTDLSQG